MSEKEEQKPKNIPLFCISSEELDGFIVAHDENEIMQAINCMHGGCKADDYSEDSDFISISIRMFDEDEYKKLMQTEWQP